MTVSTRTTSQPQLANPIRVTHANRNAFQRALTRGQGRRLGIELFVSEHHQTIDGTTRRYQVQAWSQPGLTHDVVIFKSAGGAVEAACDCAAAFGGRPCQHASLAIQDAGWWPWPVASQLDAIKQLTWAEPTDELQTLLSCITIQNGRFVYERCPHCGSDHEHGLVTYQREADYTHDWFTRCTTCNASPGWAKDVHAAIAERIAAVVKDREAVTAS